MNIEEQGDINIVFSSDERYTRHAGVAIMSILRHVAAPAAVSFLFFAKIVRRIFEFERGNQMNQHTNRLVVDLLWTGGWDSTFRLLQLCRMKHVIIQPHYIIDWGRGSHRLELETMEKIRAMILSRFPLIVNRLRSTVLMDINTIIPNDNIRKKWRQLYEQAPLGIQYQWLAEYALEHGLKNLEMSVVKEIGSIHLKEVCELRQTPSLGELWYLSERIDDNSPYSIFRDFSFPVLGVSKPEMLVIAEQEGVLDILNHSWFCFSPIKGQPCGLCNPCKCAIEGGMSHRLPLAARLRHRYKGGYLFKKRTQNQIKSFRKKIVGLFQR